MACSNSGPPLYTGIEADLLTKPIDFELLQMKVRSKLSLVSRVRLREDILEYGGSEGVEARVDTSSSIHFSPREKQVLAELVNGHTNMRIAEIVGLSEHTVGDYVKSVYKKL